MPDESLVAPAGCAGIERPWFGRAAIKPWEYRVTVAIPHLETPETLPVLLDLLALQSTRPYVLIIDTGSCRATCDIIEALRSPTVEIHYVRAHGYAHSSAPVTVAMDVAFALCRTKYLFCTHTDVFPRRRDLLESLLLLCGPEQPAVGYEMSPRENTQAWRNVLSHTCSMLYMPVMRMIGASWSMERYWESGKAAPQGPGFPDTEQPLDLCLRRAGIYPYIIGHDVNHARFVDANIDHARSVTGLRLYNARSEMHATAEAALEESLTEGIGRARQWRQKPR